MDLHLLYVELMVRTITVNARQIVLARLLHAKGLAHALVSKNLFQCDLNPQHPCKLSGSTNTLDCLVKDTVFYFADIIDLNSVNCTFFTLLWKICHLLWFLTKWTDSDRLFTARCPVCGFDPCARANCYDLNIFCYTKDCSCEAEFVDRKGNVVSGCSSFGVEPSESTFIGYEETRSLNRVNREETRESLIPKCKVSIIKCAPFNLLRATNCPSHAHT